MQYPDTQRCEQPAGRRRNGRGLGKRMAFSGSDIRGFHRDQLQVKAAVRNLFREDLKAGSALADTRREPQPAEGCAMAR